MCIYIYIAPKRSTSWTAGKAWHLASIRFHLFGLTICTEKYAQVELLDFYKPCLFPERQLTNA